MTAADDSVPLGRVEVSLTMAGRPRAALLRTSTAGDGRYEILEIPPGRYVLSASKRGYVPSAYGQSEPSDVTSPLELRPAAVVEDLNFALRKGGVISGTVVDEVGDPLSGATVSAARFRYKNWQEWHDPPTSVKTDDLGRFRIWGLRPGPFRLWATTSRVLGGTENRRGYPQTYYPGTLDPGEARTLLVEANGQIPGLVISMSPRETGSIVGTVYAGDGSRVRSVIVGLVAKDLSGIAGSTGGRSIFSQYGDFAFSDIAPGTYTLTASGGGLFGATVVQCAGGLLTNLTLSMSAPHAIRGHVVFQGSGAPELRAVTVTLISLDAMPVGPPPEVATDGTFEARDIHSRRVLVRASAPGWTLDEVLVDGFDRVDDPVELDRPGVKDVEVSLRHESSASGVVIDGYGASIPNASVVIFSSDSSRWTKGTRFVARTTADASGRFAIPGLPPGQYILIARGHLEAGEETNPKLLESWLRMGTRLSLADGATQVVQLRGVAR